MDRNSGLIPENILESILDKTDIVELIAGYIPLKRAGRNFKANCPFHHEKTPSFMVSSDKQIYHCFGCGAGGNAFNFLMQYERMEFPEAVETLAQKTGITLPKRQDNRQDESINQSYRANELSCGFYADNLNRSEGLKAKNYLLSRGIKPETIEKFRIGYAQDKWDGLINFLRQQKINLSAIDKAGLIIAKQNSGYYDRFRNRIIFPIWDIKSRVLAFGARVMDASLPKYINSPETVIYSKGKCLYGLNSSKEAIRQQDCAVIVEGYLDLIIPFQEGICNIAASLGTALTSEQARLIRRYSHNVVMVYDGDAAGQMATLRALDIFIEEGMNVMIAPLPKGFDPDSFVRKFGAQAFKDAIQKAQTLFDYKIRLLKERFNAQSIEGKAKICQEMLPTINRHNNAILKSEYLRKLAQELKIDEVALLQESGRISLKSPAIDLRGDASRKKELKVNPTEKLLVKLLLEEAELINRIKEDLTPADFQDERISRIVSAMLELAEQGKTIDTLSLINRSVNEEVSQIICESTFLPDVSEDEKEKIICECINRIKKRNVVLRRERLHVAIKSAQRTGDEEKLKQLVEEFHCLITSEKQQ